MHYQPFVIGLALALAIALGACKKQEQPARSQPQPQSGAPAESNPPPASVQTTVTNVTPAAPETNKPVLLRVQWSAGGRYVYRMDVEQHSTNQVAQGAEPRREDLTLGVTYALAVLPNAAHRTTGEPKELELEFLANELESKMGDKILVAFDSSEASTNSTDNPIAGPFRRVIRSKVRLQLDSGGAVDKVLGLEDWTRAVVGDDTGAGGHMVAQMFNEGFFRQVADYGRALSAQTVEPGQEWPYHTQIPAGALGTIDAQSTITFKRWEEHDSRRLTVLATQGTLKGVPAAAQGSDAGLCLDNGTVTGISWFDPELGTVVESEVSQFMRLKGEIPGQADGSRPPLSFTSDIGQKVTLKLVEFRKENAM